MNAALRRGGEFLRRLVWKEPGYRPDPCDYEHQREADSLVGQEAGLAPPDAVRQQPRK